MRFWKYEEGAFKFLVEGTGKYIELVKNADDFNESTWNGLHETEKNVLEMYAKEKAKM